MYLTMGVRRFRRRYDDRPRPLQDDEPAVLRAAYDWGSRLGNRLLRHKVHPPSKKYSSSCLAPPYVANPTLPLRCGIAEIGCGSIDLFASWYPHFAGTETTATLQGMDSVRFGRALGIGARAAAKTLASAVDAATTPNPATQTKTPPANPPASASKAESSGARLGQQAAQTATQMRQTGAGLKRGGKRFGEAVWGPFVKASGQLWLELTGVFFGLFAVSAAIYIWRLRGDLHETATNHEAHVHLLVSVAVAVVFGYFCVSSFVKANRRGKQS
jgi:hypothetical protein